MANPPRLMMGDYCRRTEADQISLGFQPTKNVTFNIKNYVLSGLGDKFFEGQAIIDP